jgi:hypothetical protein
MAVQGDLVAGCIWDKILGREPDSDMP